jgi:serine/threonine protein kinase
VPQGTKLPLIDGRFRLLKLLAVGGMGELYLATAQDSDIEGLEHLVVMKRILPAYATNRAVVTMFLTEAHIAARLDHPNVVRVYDMGRAGGSLYFTMEYLHGVDLGKLFDATKRRGAMFPLGHAVTIALGVCDGLHFAHEMCRVDGTPMGVVHRDVSPGNVFITFDGEVKLVDFGIAKVLSSTHHTQAGTRKGKFAYMSPEQVKAGPIDRRTDIFAIGILLYEMVTLSLLFDGESDYAIMQQIASGDIPPPSTRHPGVAPELERIILKALAHDPDDRYPTALALAEDLARFAWKSDIRVSTVALKQTLKRLIGDAEYPWYLDEEGPEEADAVAHWFASAQPDEQEEEIEDLEISLTDLVLLDDDIEEVDEPGAEPEVVEPTRVQRPTQRPVAGPPQAAPPRHPPPSRAPLVGAAAAATGIVAVLLAWRCRPEIPPPPPPVVAPPLVAPPLVPVAHPVVRAPEPPPVVTPSPEDSKKSAKKSKRKRATKKK